MVYLCREKNLNAELADAISFLNKTKTETLGGIVACQFVEHLPTDILIEFVKLCHNKLKRGGRVVLETLNPESVHTMKWFYLDLYHQKPIHPKALKFLMESIGFMDVTLTYLSPVPTYLKLTETGEENIDRLNKFLFADQEYAIVATR
jgi:O-antigen chain-terminating methyltransferase